MSAFNEGPDYYRKGGIQPIEYITSNDLSFIEGNVIKYVTRWKNKNGLEDLTKARHYLDLLIEQENDRLLQEWIDGSEADDIVDMVNGSFYLQPDPTKTYYFHLGDQNIGQD